MKKINITYLKKNFDLKKFLKFIDKPSGIEENFEIYNDFIDACATKKIKSDQLWNIYYDQIHLIRSSLIGKFMTGDFFPFISKNFKVLEYCKITEAGVNTDPSLAEFYYAQLISSKMNKKYYIASYHGKYTTINDSYNIIKSFKNKQKAYDFLDIYIFKKEDEFEKSGR